MNQALVKKGRALAEQVPAPIVSKGGLLIRVVNSCISAGTEMSGLEASGKSLITRAMEQPSNIYKAIDMVRSEGIARSLKKISDKLEECRPTGYSVAGIVLGVGEGVTRFKIGDYVAAAGAGFANHAEYVDVPEQLVMPMPKTLDFEKASTVALGGIAMQGVRRANVSIGDFCVVVGAGILGLLTVQMLASSGVRVIVVDIDQHRLDIASELGAEITINSSQNDPVRATETFTNGCGADAVVFTAATNSSAPLSQAFQMSRKKGKVILVGVAGMSIKREDVYAKELDLLISTSYGPGRYDKNYEEKGVDYPYAYVRWTENRNMQEYLRLVDTGAIKLDKLIDRIYPIVQASEAFESLKTREKRPLMVILDYGKPDLSKLDEYLHHERRITIDGSAATKKGAINVAMVGVGGFAVGTHLPNMEKLGSKFRIHSVMNRTGYKAKAIAEKYGAKYATTDYNEILNDAEVDLVLISTRHDSHADLILKALQAGKNVFVEKPLATNIEDLDRIKQFYANDSIERKPLLFVGFNRRFSRYAREIKKHTDKRLNPLFIRYRMNAGYRPLDSWVHEDGGRIIGEACHIIDLMTYFTGTKIVSVSVESMTPKSAKYSHEDNKTIVLKYDDGSVCSIDYFAVGSPSVPKEMMEIHFDEKTIFLNDFKSITGHDVKVASLTSPMSEKGHLEELESLYESMTTSGAWPIGLWDMIQTTEASFLAAGM